MNRLATAGDATFAAEKVQEFREQVGNPEPIDTDRFSLRIQRWPLVQAVDDEHGVYCELKVREQAKDAERGHPLAGPNMEFAGAFPRGASKGVIGPVFSVCARAAIAHYPKREQAAVRRWPVWGTFMHGQDEQRVPDGGKAICESWEAFYLARGRLSIRVERYGGIYLARMDVGDLADDGL